MLVCRPSASWAIGSEPIRAQGIIVYDTLYIGKNERNDIFKVMCLSKLPWFVPSLPQV